MTANSDEIAVKTAQNGQQEEDDSAWNNGVVIVFHILLPLAVAGIIWGRKAIITKLLQHLDKSCLSVFCPTFSKREKLLKWTMTHLPYLEGGLGSIWVDGSQLCALINSVVPGACPNPHRHWRKPPTHGQALAYKYLGIIPIFTEADLTQRNLNAAVEKRLIDYLHLLQQAVSKISHNDNLTFSNHYIARGMGLVTGEQFRKTTFYIYPNPKSKKLENLLISIRGPYHSYGAATLLCQDLEKSDNSQETSNESTQKSFFNFSNLLTLKNTKEPICDITIKTSIETDRAKVIFIPQNSGVYEVCLTTSGEHIAGSPYNINIEKNRSGIVDKLSDQETNFKIRIKRAPIKDIIKNSKPTMDIHNSKPEIVTKEENNNEIIELVNETVLHINHSSPVHIILKDINESVSQDDKAAIQFNSATVFESKTDTTHKNAEEDVCYLIINESNNNEIVIKNTSEQDSDSSSSENWNLIDLQPNTECTITTTLDTACFVLSDTEEEVTSRMVNGDVSDVSDGNVKEAPVPAQISNGFSDHTRSNSLHSESHSSEEGVHFKENFLKCREFWDKLSSSNTSLTSSCVSLSDSTDTSKLYWVNPQCNEQQDKHEYTFQNKNNYSYRYRSLDFIKQRMKLQRTNSLQDKYASVDDLNVPSVKERKDKFLNGSTSTLRSSNLSTHYSTSTDELSIQSKQVKCMFGSIHEKIKLFDNGAGKEQVKFSYTVKKLKPTNNVQCKSYINKNKQLPENGTITTKIKERFHKAQTFFMKLENNTESDGKRCRRHSLGNDGNTKSFKGVTSRNGMVRTLNSLTPEYHHAIGRTNGIQLKMFLNRKKKERKSLHDIFQY